MSLATGQRAPAWTPFRRQLLELVPVPEALLAPHPTTAFVWPTEACSVGCAHCSFGSVRRRPGEPSDVRLDPGALVDWLVDARARSVVLCGGGEPLDEPELCRDVVARASRTHLGIGVYTAGASLDRPREPRDVVQEWVDARADDHTGSFSVRLSFDVFHTRRLGTGVLAAWVEAIEELAPAWRLSLRGLRVVGDPTLDELARTLGAHVEERSTSARLVLRSGRRVPVERMAYIVDGRGSLAVLARHGVALPPQDAAALAPLVRAAGRGDHLGRPLSRRLTVGPAHVDLEIHADTTVHVLESQAPDLRLSFETHPWDAMRAQYYRDPLVHAVAVGGLPLAASFVQDVIDAGAAPRSTMPFSVEHLDDPDVLDRVTALAVVRLAPVLGYPDAVVALARTRTTAPLTGVRP